MSFSGARFLEFPPRALSLRWYAAYWSDAAWLEATALVLESLSKLPPSSSITESRRAVAATFREAAKALGNTVTVCRKYYVHPEIIELFLHGQLAAASGGATSPAGRRLQAEERLLLRLLKRLERRPRRP